MEAPRRTESTDTQRSDQHLEPGVQNPVSNVARMTLSTLSSIEPINIQREDHTYSSPLVPPSLNQHSAVVNEKDRFDERYLNEAFHTFDEMAGHISDCLYSELIIPKVEKLQSYTATLPQMLNSMASFALDLGNVAEKNSGLLLQDNIVKSALSKDFTFLLRWMTTNDFISPQDQATYKETLLNATAKKLESKLESYEEVFLLPSLQWIFSTDHSISFNDHFKLLNPNELIYVKKVCHLAMKELINQKVETYCEHITDVINNRLGNLIKLNMRDNAIRKLVNFNSEHLLKVIQRINWTNLIDDSVTNVYEHTNAYLKATEALNTWETDKANSDYVLFLQKFEFFRNHPDDLPQKVKADYIQYKATQSDPLVYLKEVYTSLRDYQYWIAYIKFQPPRPRNADDYIVHRVVRTIISNEINKNPNAEKEDKGATDLFFRRLANQLVDILFSDEMNTLKFWTTHFSVSAEIKHVFDTSVRIASQVTNERLMTLIVNGIMSNAMRQFADSFISEGMESAKLYLSDLLTKALKNQLNHYSNPETLKGIFADTLLPNVLIPKFVEMAAKTVLFKKIDYYSIKLEAVFADKLSLESFYEELFQETQKALSHTPFSTINMTSESFAELLNSTIIPVSIQLSGTDRPATWMEIKRELTKPSPAKIITERKPQYGDLINNLVTHMTNLRSSKLVRGFEWGTSVYNAISWGVRKVSNKDIGQFTVDKFLTETLGQIFMSSMENLRESPAFTIGLLMDSIKNQFSEANLKAMLSKDPVKANPSLKELENALTQASEEEIQVAVETFGGDEKPVKEVQKKIRELQDQIEQHPVNINLRYTKKLRIVTDLIYDLAFTILNENSKISNFIIVQNASSNAANLLVKKILGEPQDFHEMIANLFHQLLMDNQRRNQSMIYEMAGYIFQSMHDVSERIRPTRRPMHSSFSYGSHPGSAGKTLSEEELLYGFPDS